MKYEIEFVSGPIRDYWNLRRDGESVGWFYDEKDAEFAKECLEAKMAAENRSLNLEAKP